MPTRKPRVGAWSTRRACAKGWGVPFPWRTQSSLRGSESHPFAGTVFPLLLCCLDVGDLPTPSGVGNFVETFLLASTLRRMTRSVRDLSHVSQVAVGVYAQGVKW